MCLRPHWIYKKGKYKRSNYRGEEGSTYEIGTYTKCGHCEVCMNDKSNSWLVRNFFEERKHAEKCFVTLTYAESPVILVRKDLTNFIKRFRTYLDRNGGQKVRLFYSGEYGEKRGRCHFHIIIYGWNDENRRYIGINKKGNILYQSDIIQKLWKKGRTTIQTFDQHESIYIALYSTPKEEFHKAVKLTRENLKRLEDKVKNPRYTKEQKENLIEELEKLRKKFDETKKKYLMVKEFNGWSLALGWENFYNEYANAEKYIFTHYIEDKILPTPTPWLKKLANMGYIDAAEELFRREKEMIQAATEEEERTRNVLRVLSRKKRDIQNWKEQKNEAEEL